MKLSRLNVRNLLLLVALAGVALGTVAWMQRRVDHFRAEASRHLALWMVLAPDGTSPALARRAMHHLELVWKYEDASRRPWLPAGLDPPEPE